MNNTRKLLWDHHIDPTVPTKPRPHFVELMQIPPRCNRGVFELIIAWLIVREILYGPTHANAYNRYCKRPRLRPIKLAFETGTFVPFFPDPLMFDWDWYMFNAQKRLIAGYETYLEGKLHPKYKDGIPMRIEYGINPDYRCLADCVQERDRSDQIALVDNVIANKDIHQACTLVAKLNAHINTSSLCAVDAKSIYDSNPEGFQWITTLKRGSLNTVPLRLAFAEGYKLDAEKTKLFASELLNVNYTDQPDGSLPRVQQARDYRDYRDKKHGPDDERGADQTNPYNRLVYCMNCYFNGVPASRINARTLPHLGWPAAQLNRLGYPNLYTVTSKVLTQKIDLGQFGITNGEAATAALRIIFRNPNLPTAVVEQEIAREPERWRAACDQLKLWRGMVTTYSWGSVLAFCYLNPGFNVKRLLTPNMSTELGTIVQRIKKNHGDSLGSRQAREMCYTELCRVTGVRNPL